MTHMFELSGRELKITAEYVKGSNGKGRQHARSDREFQQRDSNYIKKNLMKMQDIKKKKLQ